MKKIRHKKGWYRAERKDLNKVNEELVAELRKTNRFDRYKRPRYHQIVKIHHKLYRKIQHKLYRMGGSYKL